MALTETTTNADEPPTPFAYPPLPWIGARFKFEVREKDGHKCLVKTTDNPFFQRATVFMGPPDLKNYTVEADVMSDGNKRKMSTVGVINQRYRIVLKGNEQVLEITSNEHCSARRRRPSTGSRTSGTPQGAGGCGAGRLGRHPRQGLEKGRPGAGGVDQRSARRARQRQRLRRLVRILPQNMRVYIDNIAVRN